MTFQEFQSNPEFAKLSYNEQRKARAAWVMRTLPNDPEFNALDDTSQLEAVQAIIDSKPVFEREDEHIKTTLQIRDAMVAGDQDALELTKRNVIWAQGTKGSLIANAIVGAVDIFDGDDKETYQALYGKDGKKLQEYLVSSMDPVSRADTMQKMKEAAIAVNVAETLMLNVGLVGTMGKAGLLTKGLMGQGGRIAKWATTLPAGMSYAVASELGEEAVQAGLSALITTGSRAAVSLMQDPEYRPTVEQFASEVGQEILMDWLAWAGLSIAASGFKAIRYAATGHSQSISNVKRMARELTPEQFQETFVKTVLKNNPTGREMRELLDPETRKVVEAYQGGEMARLMTEELSKPRGIVKVAGQAGGFLVADDGVNIRIKPVEKLDVEGIERTFQDPREALRFIRENSTKEVMPLVEGGIDRSEVVATLKTKIPEVATFNPRLAARLVQPSVGNLNPNNIEFAVKDLLRNAGVKDEVLSPFKFIPDPNYFTKTRKITEELQLKEIKIPLSLDNPTHLTQFRRDLIDNIRTLGQGTNQDTLNHLIDGLNKELDDLARFGDMNLSTMRFVAENTLKRPVVELGGGRIKIGDETFNNWREANRAIMRDVIGMPTQDGGLSVDELNQLVREHTGGTFQHRVKVIDPETGTKVDVFELRNAKGEILDTGDSPLDVIMKRPEVLDALSYPSSYGPRVMVIDANQRILQFNQTAAIGTIKDILEMGSKFKSFKTYRTFKVGTDTFELEADPKLSRWVLRIPETGAEKEFISGSEMLSHIKKNVKSFEELRNELYRRTFNSYVDVDGSVIVYDGVGEATRLASKEQLEQFLKDHPIPAHVEELIPVDIALKDEIELKVKKVLEKEQLWRNRVEKSTLRKAIVSASQTVSTMIAPTESTLARIARNTGNPAALNGWREMRRMQKFLNQKDALAKASLEGIWKGTKDLERSRASILLQMAETKWKDFYKNTYGEELSRNLYERTLKQKAWDASMYTAVGLDPSKRIQNYVPHIKNHLAQLQSSNLKMPKTTKGFLKQVFGDQIPKELSFFAEHMRLDAFLDAVSEKDVARAAGIWANGIYKKQYLGSALGTINKGLEHIRELADKGLISEADVKFYTDSVQEFFGVKTTLGKQFEQASINITTALSKIAEKVPLFKKWGWDKSIVTNDLIGKLNTWFTYATQSWRAWAIPRNTTQTYLLSAFTGVSTPWKALDYVLSNPEYAGDLVSKGWISETLYTLGSENLRPVKGFWARGLSPLEMTEVLTRATAFRTAEMMLDSSMTRLLKGTINVEQFSKELSLSMMDAPLYKQFMGLISAGDKKSATKLLGDYFQDSTMFIYGKGQGGTATRGVVGRLFGKLGVYPLGTLDLYAKIATRGTGPEKIARATRLMAASTALYWAFNQGGIDYQGFLWTDPFEFSGGPFFSMAIDLTKAVGGGPEASLARSNLKRGVPSGLVPGYALGKKVVEGIQYGMEGDIERMLMGISGAPNIVKEDKIRQFTLFGYK